MSSVGATGWSPLYKRMGGTTRGTVSCAIYGKFKWCGTGLRSAMHSEPVICNPSVTRHTLPLRLTNVKNSCKLTCRID